ncbi:MAG: universal stress protein [Candidatus Nanopelagicales bacterium]
MSDQFAQQGRGRIVVGIDGSEESKWALRWAARMAPALEADIEVIGAWQYPLLVGVDAMAVTSVPELMDPEGNAKQLMELTLADVFGDGRPTGLTMRFERGQPAHVLIEASRGATMLIVGSRGHGGFTGLLLGSVSSACAEHAKCPVLVVHGE